MTPTFFIALVLAWNPIPEPCGGYRVRAGAYVWDVPGPTLTIPQLVPARYTFTVAAMRGNIEGPASEPLAVRSFTVTTLAALDLGGAWVPECAVIRFVPATQRTGFFKATISTP